MYDTNAIRQRMKLETDLKNNKEGSHDVPYDKILLAFPGGAGKVDIDFLYSWAKEHGWIVMPNKAITHPKEYGTPWFTFSKAA